MNTAIAIFLALSAIAQTAIDPHYIVGIDRVPVRNVGCLVTYWQNKAMTCDRVYQSGFQS